MGIYTLFYTGRSMYTGLSIYTGFSTIVGTYIVFIIYLGGS